MRLGFVGLGELGGHLAANLVKAGFDLVVHDRDMRRADRLVATGAHGSESPRALARDRDAVLTCLPSPAASKAVLAELLEADARAFAVVEHRCVYRARQPILRVLRRRARIEERIELRLEQGVHRHRQETARLHAPACTRF